jgi:hypothetical protein
MPALTTLLRGAVDYAGLFPPAALAMAPAARNYAAYRAGAERWMLGRFVVPAVRLDELAAAVAALADAGRGVGPWRLSALVGADVEGELARIDAFNARHAARGATHDAVHDAAHDAAGGDTSGDAPDSAVPMVVDAVELMAADERALRAVARAIAARRDAPHAPYAREAYVEVPLDPDPAPLAAAARETGVRLKARTGGVTADAFPPPALVLRFLVRCADAGVACKATAGLHHALRGEHPLTYEPGCPRGTMFGFLAVLLADALLRGGAEERALLPLLEERDPRAFAFDDAGASWRGPHATLRAGVDAIAAARAGGLASFGSCSFEEPVAELRALGLLPRPTPHPRASLIAPQ